MRDVFIANRHPRLRYDRRAIARVIALLDEHHASLANRHSTLVPSGELSVVFLTDAALAKLHADFLDDPTITDVITFEGDAALRTAGEICVSADAAARQVGLPLAGGSSRSAPSKRVSTAARQQAPVLQKEFSAELTLYLVHGWLHLAGHDDLVPVKKRAMRRAEARAMRFLERAGAVPTFSLRTAR